MPLLSCCFARLMDFVNSLLDIIFNFNIGNNLMNDACSCRISLSLYPTCESGMFLVGRLEARKPTMTMRRKSKVIEFIYGDIGLTD